MKPTRKAMKTNGKSYKTFTRFRNQKNIVPRKNKIKILYIVKNQKNFIVS